MENTKTTRQGSWILTYFWHSRWHYFGYISWKVAKPHFLKKSTEVSQSTSPFISIGMPINSLLKIWKTSVFLTALFSNEKIADIWNFEWIKLLDKGLSYLKKWGIGVNYRWNYGPSKLLLYFIEYRLNQLNNNHTKKTSKLGNTVFLRLFSKEISTKSLKFFGPPTTKWRPCKIFAKLNGNHLLMANIFKLHEYQTFGLMKIHNMCKIWFANKIFSLLRWNKKYFSWFFKGFQLPEIVSDLRLHL